MNNFLVVLKKELKDIFRDKKTVLFTIILPIILFPVMYKLMGYGMESSMKSASEEIKISITGEQNSSIYNLLQGQKNVTFESPEDPKQALKDGDLQLIIDVPKNFDAEIKKGNNPKLDILYDDSSNNSSIALSFVESLISGLEDSIVSDRLKAQGIDTSILKPIELNVKSSASLDGEEVNPMARTLGGMMPSLIIVFMFAPILGIAADLGAGEKERNTFEPLLSTSCDRNSLLFGKIIAISVVSALTMIASLISMYVGLQGFIKSMASMGGHEGSSSLSFDLSFESIILMIFLLLILLLAICAIQISISIFARSTKEAGTYLSGVITPIMIISYIPMFMDAKDISSFVFHLPIANSVALMKEFMVGISNFNHVGIVFFWNIIYLILAILATKYMFSREEVVFRS
ncbi:MAG: ABC transporter permease [Clostridium sp.]|uniref:ABC transporter permease n=1 Tax=Clostridium sp. TaxID=1506 RepID=UPI003F35319F